MSHPIARVGGGGGEGGEGSERGHVVCAIQRFATLIFAPAPVATFG